MKHSAHSAKHASTAVKKEHHINTPSRDASSSKTRHTVTISVGAVLSGVENHPDELEDGDDQGAERNGSEGKRRGADEGAERRVLGLGKM